MQAIILAAGMGKRLKDLTENNTKCMVKVNGTTMIERILRQIDAKNLSKIIIVVGYEGQKLIDYIATLNINTKIEFVDNPIYDKTNNIYSLSLAKEFLEEDDTLLFESDLIIEDKIIDLLLEDERDTLALVDKYESWMDGTVIKIDEEDNILDFVPGKNFVFEDINKYYKTVNIYKFSKHFSCTHYVPFLEAYSKALGDNEYYEQVLKVISIIDNPIIKAKRLNGEKWYEIDDIQDLNIAESIFCEDKNRLNKLETRYGGYWRYPKMTDFCYLVNPYFPPKRLMDEIKASFETLLTEYPSGQAVNSLLAAKNFGIAQKNIVVGNGAAELIKSMMENMTGSIGIVRPTFEEYPNRKKTDMVVFEPKTRDFSYTADDIIAYFSEKKVDNLVIINPDNPTGNYIDCEGLKKLIDWTEDNNVFFVLDESFVDFATEENTLINQDILDEHRNLAVVKSISKSYGVPGLRLGILASGNQELIAYLKKDVAIWNINSFAEFYLQIYEKYKKDYQIAIDNFKIERERYETELENIPGIRPIHSEANYLMLELAEGIKARELSEKLLLNYNILIKDLSAKISGRKNEYVRIAVRNKNDNDMLINALKECLCEE